MLDVPFSAIFETFKYIRESGIRNKEKLTDYLDSIVVDVEKLKAVWEGNLMQLRETAKAASKRSKPDQITLIERTIPTGSNAAFFYLVKNHYEKASSIINGRIAAPERDQIITALGEFIHRRNRLVVFYEGALETIDNSGREDRDKVASEVRYVEEALNDLLEVGADFQLLVAAYKAS